VILLAPGPVNVSPRVTAALARGDLCHREPEFAQLLDLFQHFLHAAAGLEVQSQQVLQVRVLAGDRRGCMAIFVFSCHGTRITFLRKRTIGVTPAVRQVT